MQRFRTVVHTLAGGEVVGLEIEEDEIKNDMKSGRRLG